jgi:hypothetical protein
MVHWKPIIPGRVNDLKKGNLMNNNIFKSIIKNIEKFGDVEVSIIMDGFWIDSDDPEEKLPGYVIQVWGDRDEYYPEGRILRQVAFDLDGNPYRFAASGSHTYFRPVPRDGFQYGGFTFHEVIELVRFRDWIISH